MNPDKPSLEVVALVLHARHVPSEAREQFAAAAAAFAGDPRVILLRTCHRVELYATASAADGSEGRPALPFPELPEGGQRLVEDEAIRHLFTVAAGLDSVVVGEDQILHQLRECLAERQLVSLDSTGESCSIDHRAALPGESTGDLEPVLDRLFQLALHVGRQSRAWREGPHRSLADVALDRIEAAGGGDLAGRALLVVGAGQMGRLAALAAARRHARVFVSNRAPDRARALAADADGDAIIFGSIPAELAGAIVAVGGPWVLNPDAEVAMAEGQGVVVDLSSPPAVGSPLRERLGSRFVSVDDIARGPIDPVRQRSRHRIERLIDEASAELARWFGGRAAVPAILALTAAAETRRLAEMDRLLRRLPHLAGHDRELVEQMTHRLVAGLLHAPLTSLREDQTGEHDRAARELFSQ